MPEYLSPGVYIEEIEIGGKPIEGVGTSTAGFLGQTERGPITPTLVTGFEEFRRFYGYYIDKSYLAYAVDGFFRNGGKRCFIGRIVHQEDDPSKSAANAFIESTSLKVEAVGPGNWGKRIAFKIEPAGLEKGLSGTPKLFKLTVMYFTKEIQGTLKDPDTLKITDPARIEPNIRETFDNISADPESPDYFLKKVNGISNLIVLTATTGKEGTRPTDVNITSLGDPKVNYDGAAVVLADFDGKEKEVTVNGKKVIERSGLTGFEYTDEINFLCAPDDHAIEGLYDKVVDHCEKLKDRFAILQSKESDAPSRIGSMLPPRPSDYAAFYYPWINIIDPRTNREKLIPPGGQVAGIYARSDIERGVWKAPANEIVRGARSLQFTISTGQQDILNPRGINVIRAFPGRGIRVWGARTTSNNPLWKYINVRRLFLFLEESVEESTQWVVFEPNNEQLWARIKQTITAFLVPVWRTGALMGTTPEEAFFVKVDRTTMTQNDIDTGKLIVIIGVAPTKPAEFVIFRFTQFTANAEAA